MAASEPEVLLGHPGGPVFARGQREFFPELDRVAWFAPAEARRRLKPTQIPFIDRLIAAVASESFASQTAR